MSKICFITAIYGSYEATCKRPVEQTVPTDFICFTDNPTIIANGWTIDTTPYHITHPSPLDNGTYINSLCNNKHTFNVAKYYKQSFQCIPRLKDYDCVVWLDGTIEIIHNQTSEFVLNAIKHNSMVAWEHNGAGGMLYNEVMSSIVLQRYSGTFWNRQKQPVQDVVAQYNFYIDDGYNNAYWRYQTRYSNNYGVWITCFLAFDNKNDEISRFLDLWYQQTLQYTTQDQVSFPYVCWKLKAHPYTLPNHEINAVDTNKQTSIYIKHDHGK